MSKLQEYLEMAEEKDDFVSIKAAPAFKVTINATFNGGKYAKYGRGSVGTILAKSPESAAEAITGKYKNDFIKWAKSKRGPNGRLLIMKSSEYDFAKGVKPSDITPQSISTRGKNITFTDKGMMSYNEYLADYGDYEKWDQNLGDFINKVKPIIDKASNK